jgi:hypothetical protein
MDLLAVTEGAPEHATYTLRIKVCGILCCDAMFSFMLASTFIRNITALSSRLKCAVFWVVLCSIVRGKRFDEGTNCFNFQGEGNVDMTRCCLLGEYSPFGRTYYFHLQG